MAEKKEKDKTLKAVRSADFKSVYVNFSHFSLTNLELIIDSGIRNQDEVEISTRMIMSPEHAKVFAEKLKEVIEIHKKNTKDAEK